MIKNPDKFEEFERSLIASEPVNIAKNFQIFEAMYKEALALGILPSKNPMEGFETKLKIARIINNVSETSVKNSKNSKRK